MHEHLAFNPQTYATDRGFEDVYHYQEWFGLKSDGIAGPITTESMLEPKCGCKDILAADGPQPAKWPEACQRNVTTAYQMRLPGVTDEQLRQAWLLALKIWNDVCGINMTLIDDLASARIWARAGRLPGSTLAWSFLANGSCRSRLEQRYDTLVTWFLEERDKPRPQGRVSIAATILHEIGHALGMPHSNDRRDIMYPSILGKAIWSYPGPGDLAWVQDAYGMPDTPVDPEPELDLTIHITEPGTYTLTRS